MLIPHSAHKSIVVKLSFAFSMDMVDLCTKLELEHKYAFSRQLFRSSTSIGANVIEAQNAESKPDFIHKMKIAAKEAEETEYWLLLGHQSPYYPDMQDHLNKVYELKKILNKIISTSKNKL